MNTHFGLINEVWLVVIHQNGGFTKVWIALKCFFLPLIVATMAWYWHRIKILERAPTLLEGSIFALAIIMAAIDGEFLPSSFVCLRPAISSGYCLRERVLTAECLGSKP